MTIIRDSSTSKAASVNDEGELVTRSIIESELEHASISGKAYSWDSTELDIDAGDTMLFIKNTSDTPLLIDRANFHGSNVVCTWTIRVGTASTTPAGNTVNGQNLNTNFFNRVPDAVAFSDETAVADGNIIDRVKTPIGLSTPVSLDGVIILKNHWLQITQDTESTSGSVAVCGHFANPE